MNEISTNRFGRKETKLDRVASAFRNTYGHFLNAKPGSKKQKEFEEQCKIYETIIKKLKADGEKTVGMLAVEKAIERSKKRVRSQINN